MEEKPKLSGDSLDRVRLLLWRMGVTEDAYCKFLDERLALLKSRIARDELPGER